ncbi:hypothetical protein F5X97DRAFT_326779 [Nemania serpens]|nr:hypothetical protein F5X97DRAFT_326779 [Nemania serpens]
MAGVAVKLPLARGTRAKTRARAPDEAEGLSYARFSSSTSPHPSLTHPQPRHVCGRPPASPLSLATRTAVGAVTITVVPAVIFAVTFAVLAPS